ncbi:MAG TPA: hypothetical protein VJT78_12785 [Candidatus Dormibacteraeota bacterium]|nr:hypothetical protein [Candidatus Dormibacteraeota bacterium]
MGSEVADVTTNLGLFKVGLVVFGLLLIVIVVDAVLITRREDTYFGHWAQAWARRYPAFALAISFFFGALIGHFFWNTWNPG